MKKIIHFFSCELLPFFRDVIRWNVKGPYSYQLYLGMLFMVMLLGWYAYSQQLRYGLVETGMNNIVSWGLYVSNFTFLVGVAAAAVMLILPAYVLGEQNFHRVVIIGEGIAVGALVMCLAFIIADLGSPARAWHLIPFVGIFNFPNSILAWDVIVLNGYLLLNLLVPFYILFHRYHDREPRKTFYVPFVFLSIFWAFAIHLVTAFLYEGLPARPFWNNPLMGPRFLASAFTAGPALILFVLTLIHVKANFTIHQNVFDKLRLIMTGSAIVNLIMLFSEIFKEFYWTTQHSQSAMYLFFGLEGHNALVPWIWTSIFINTLATLILTLHPKRSNPTVLSLTSLALFLAIWMEKGLGLIVPGFIPSPLGEIVDYTPSWIEIGVTAGILALGIFVVSILVRSAIIIENRYNKGHYGAAAVCKK